MYLLVGDGYMYTKIVVLQQTQSFFKDFFILRQKKPLIFLFV